MNSWPKVLAAAAVLGVTALAVSAPAPNAVALVAAPTTAPVSVCANPVPGPATAPVGSVVVDPAVASDLSTKTDASPAGTTFWLAPGTHTLGTGQFNQIAPKDGDSYIGAPGAILDGKGVNLYAFTQHASNVTIKYLTVQGFVSPRDQGVVNHDSGNGWVIADNVFRNNKGGALMAGANQQVLRNCLKDNGQYAMNAWQAAGGITGLVVDGNEIVGNNTDDWETQVPGCGCTGGIKFWAVNGADVRNNWVHGNHGSGLWADTADNDFLIENNVIEDNDAAGVFYEISYNMTLRNNLIRRNAWAQGKQFSDRNDSFPIGSIYLSEAGGEPRVPARTSKVEIYGNTFVDNWGGVTGWENADRFCNSPNNTSGSYCTSLGVATASCVQPGIASAPLYSDCRWKTQNVDVHDNTFSVDPATVPGCVPSNRCARSAIVANYGSSPAWSPYQGSVVADAISGAQNNRFHDNTYTGPWNFEIHDPAHPVDVAGWRAAPWSQDIGSTFSAAPTTTPTSTVVTTTTVTAPPVTTTVTAPCPPPAPTNAVTSPSSDLESGVGMWIPWFSDTAARSTEQAHGGTASLKVNPTANFGWGVQPDNFPGFPIAAGPHTVSFWGRSGAPGSVGAVVTMSVQWKNAGGTTLGTSTVASPALSTSWQQGSAAGTAPAGTTAAYITFTGNGDTGLYLYLDDIAVG